MPDISPELLADLQRFTFYVFILVMATWLFFANTIRKTLLLIQEENRVILPNQAWFIAVPLFNIFWNFEVVKRLAYSLNNEFFDRKIAVEEMPTRRFGSMYAWAFLIYNIPFFPMFIRLLAFVLCITYFITYWFKISQYKTLIIEHDQWKQNQIEKDEN